MEYKLLYLKEVGKLRFGGRNIKHYSEYAETKDIPLFFSDQTPITAGLKLMENNESVVIVDADKVEEAIAELEGNEKDTEEKSSDTVVDKTDDDIAPEGDSDEEDTKEETDDEEDTEDEEVKGFTEDELNELTSAELDDICREENISGFSTRDKEGKIELILENQ